LPSLCIYLFIYLGYTFISPFGPVSLKKRRIISSIVIITSNKCCPIEI
jgi:hypothetical protein